MSKLLVIIVILLSGVSSFANEQAASACLRFAPNYRQQCYETAVRAGLLGMEIQDCRNLFGRGDKAIQCLNHLSHGITLNTMSWCKNHMDSNYEMTCVEKIGDRHVPVEISSFCVDNFDGDTNEMKCIEMLMDHPEMGLTTARNCENNTSVDSAAFRCMQDYLESIAFGGERVEPVQAVAR